MTQFDFKTVIDRKQKDALAIDSLGQGGNAPTHPKEGFDFIPMWVADMNFATAPSITKALQERIMHPLYGYFKPSKQYFQSIIDWHRIQHHISDITSNEIGYENGVLGGVVSAIEAFSTSGDAVLLHSPTYIGFTKSIEKSGRKIIHSPLYQDGNGVWRMDYQDMDEKLKKYHIHIAVFCSPHNPCGRVWEKEEILKAMDVFRQNDCIVISDEIWSDLILYDNIHIPTQSVSYDARNRTIALYSPSKTFNLAGMIGSYHIVYHPYLKDRLRAQAEKTHYNNMNVLSMHALIGAYSEEGREWLHQLNHTLGKNVSYVCRFIQDQLKYVTCFQPEATYMLFLDCSQYCEYFHVDVEELIQRGWDVGVGWQDGRKFHGKNHIRMNLALPFPCIVEACERLKTYVFVE